MDKEFKPNKTPKQVLREGSFGGTYFRPIYSSITKRASPYSTGSASEIKISLITPL